MSSVQKLHDNVGGWLWIHAKQCKMHLSTNSESIEAKLRRTAALWSKVFAVNRARSLSSLNALFTCENTVSIGWKLGEYGTL